MPSPDDPLYQLFLDEYQHMVENDPLVELQLPFAHAWSLLVQLQIAQRHPGNTGPFAVIGLEIGRKLQSAIAVTPTLKLVAERGWDPAYDFRVFPDRKNGAHPPQEPQP